MAFLIRPLWESIGLYSITRYDFGGNRWATSTIVSVGSYSAMPYIIFMSFSWTAKWAGGKPGISTVSASIISPFPRSPKVVSTCCLSSCEMVETASPISWFATFRVRIADSSARTPMTFTDGLELEAFCFCLFLPIWSNWRAMVVVKHPERFALVAVRQPDLIKGLRGKRSRVAAYCTVHATGRLPVLAFILTPSHILVNSWDIGLKLKWWVEMTYHAIWLLVSSLACPPIIEC